MKKVIAGVVVASILLTGVMACSAQEFDISKYFGTVVLAAEGDLPTDNMEISGNIMAVFYVKSNHAVSAYYTDGSTIIDRGDGYWDVVGSQGSSDRGRVDVPQEYCAYGLYRYKEIDITPYSSDDDPIIEVYLEDFDLQPITSEDLPHSEHIGKLTAVNPALAKPATVTRRYMGINYDIQCLVTQSVVELYQMGEIKINDYVLVSFIEEIPNGVEKHVAIVTDKVYESWS